MPTVRSPYKTVDDSGVRKGGQIQMFRPTTGGSGKARPLRRRRTNQRSTPDPVAESAKENRDRCLLGNRKIGWVMSEGSECCLHNVTPSGDPIMAGKFNIPTVQPWTVVRQRLLQTISQGVCG